MGKMGLKNNLKIFFILQILMAVTFAQLITLDKGGNVGVNFGGYSAGAGLGGLVNGNTANGGLHAYARTPHGQNAAAGLGGNIQDDGTSVGGLYANAEAGGGVAAGAGLDGTVSKTKTVVSSESDAIPVYKYVTKQVQVPAASSLEINKEIVVNKPAPEPHHVMVIPSTVETPVYIEKTVYKNRRPHLRRKYAYVNARVNSGEVYAAPPPPPPPPQVVKVVNVEKNVQPLPLDTNYAGNTRFSTNVSVNKNGNLFNDIFNIPISTLRAVNQLVNNIVGGVTVSKQVSAYGHANAGAAASTGQQVNVYKEKTIN